MWLSLTDIRVLNFIIQFVSNVFNPSNIRVVGFQQSWICPYHSLSKNLQVNIWFLPYKFNTSLYNNCHSSRQPLFIVNPHFLPTRNIPLEKKSQSQSTAQQPEPGPLWGPPELGPGDEDGWTLWHHNWDPGHCAEFKMASGKCAFLDLAASPEHVPSRF
jgi:hypothetical protein